MAAKIERDKSMLSAIYRSIDYETACSEGNFCDKSLGNVTELFTSSDDFRLSAEQKAALCNSKVLIRLKIIDFSNQDIDDDYIDKISNNAVFSRILKFDLSGNKKITAKFLRLISDSVHLGSIRDLPQNSSRFGIPSSEIRIKALNTSIAPEQVRKFNSAPQKFIYQIFYGLIRLILHRKRYIR